jgi:hypothetical protein
MLLDDLKKRSNIWHLEVYGMPFCKHHTFGRALMVCELDLSLFTNEVLLRLLERIEETIDIMPVLVKGKCPNTHQS